MKKLCAILICIFCLLGFLPQISFAFLFPISGNGTLGSFTGYIDYSYTTDAGAELTVELKNTSPVDNGGYLTAFAFNNPSDSITSITDVSLSNTDSDFVLLGGSSFDNSIGVMPYGDFDIGVSLSNKGNNPFQGGGNPQEGIGVGIEETFTFSLTVTALSNLNIQDFLGELSIGNATGKQPAFFIARFRGFNDGGSNKVLGEANRPIPEPKTIALIGIGLAGLAGVGARRKWKKKEVDKG